MNNDVDVSVNFASGLGGYKEHVERYKSYIDGLKRGVPCGISGLFGNAADILPVELLQSSAPVVVGDSIFRDGTDPIALEVALKEVMGMFEASAAPVCVPPESNRELVNLPDFKATEVCRFNENKGYLYGAVSFNATECSL